MSDKGMSMDPPSVSESPTSRAAPAASVSEVATVQSEHKEQPTASAQHQDLRSVSDISAYYWPPIKNRHNAKQLEDEHPFEDKQSLECKQTEGAQNDIGKDNDDRDSDKQGNGNHDDNKENDDNSHNDKQGTDEQDDDHGDNKQQAKAKQNEALTIESGPGLEQGTPPILSIPAEDDAAGTAVQEATGMRSNSAKELNEPSSSTPQQVEHAGELTVPDSGAKRSGRHCTPPTQGTLGNSREKRDELVFVQLFRGANNLWESDGIIWCHSSLHLLPKPTSIQAPENHKVDKGTATVTNHTEISSPKVPDDPHKDTMKNEECELVNDPQTPEVSTATTAISTAESKYAEPLPRAIAVFEQVARGRGPFDKASRNMAFVGYYKIVDLKYLAPGSQELVDMLGQKWATYRDTDTQRRADQWKESLSYEWAVIKFEKDEDATDLAPPEIPLKDHKPRGHGTHGRGGHSDRGRQSGRGGRGGWHARGRAQYHGSHPRRGRQDGNEWYNKRLGEGYYQHHLIPGQFADGGVAMVGDMSGPVWEPTDTMNCHGAHGHSQGGDSFGRQQDCSPFYPQDGYHSHRRKHGRGGHGRGYGHDRDPRDAGKSVNELIAESRGTAFEKPSNDTCYENGNTANDKTEIKDKDKPLTEHQIRNKHSVSNHHVWNEYAHNVKEHDARLMADPQGEVRRWHASAREVKSV